MEIIIILLLIILNGIFAMAEIAIISARKSKLQKQADEGNRNAQTALNLAQSPGRFLSTVQIGITFVGIFAGAFGGETIAVSLSEKLSTIPLLTPYAKGISLFLVVAFITYLSLIIGELVPKRIALNNPVTIAKFVATPMNVISSLASPLVSLLTVSTDLVFRLLKIKPSSEPFVSDEEIKLLMMEGARKGIFNLAEKDIVERTLKLSDKKINSLMTSRKEIDWLDINSPLSTLKNKIAKHPHANFPVAENGLDKVVGIVGSEDILTNFLLNEKIQLQKLIHKPIFVPESMNALKVLELFRKSGIHISLVVDEYGSVQGLVSLTDILEAIVGDIPSLDELNHKEITKREDGSFLVDGLVTIDEFKEYFKIKKIPEEHSGIFHTIGGFVIYKLGFIPSSGDKFEWENYKFEIMDMDGNRIDKALIVVKPPLSIN